MQDEAGAPLIPASPSQRDPIDPADPADAADAADKTHTGSDASVDPAGPAEPTEPAEPAEPAGSTSTRRRRLFGLLVSVTVVIYLLDQLSKWWAVSELTDEAPRDLIGSFLRLDLIRNPGAAFSIGTGNTWLLTIVAVVVLVVVIRVSRRLGSVGWAWALGLLLGGALGNLTDRVVREPGFGQGHVIDFLDYNRWFIGNIADIAIVSAAILIGLLAVTGRSVDGTRDTGRHEPSSDGA